MTVTTVSVTPVKVVETGAEEEASAEDDTVTVESLPELVETTLSDGDPVFVVEVADLEFSLRGQVVV